MAQQDDKTKALDFYQQALAAGNDKAQQNIERLQGKSARVVATMGMPAIWYRWFFRAHGVRGLERNILGFCGISPVRETLIGLVEAKSPAARQKWLDRLEALGRKGG